MGVSSKKEIEKMQTTYTNSTSKIYDKLQSHIIPHNNNNTIEDGPLKSNSINEFYRDANIFITGASGFVGKALLEKLTRSCDLLDTVYVLLRPKRGMSVEQRFKELLKNPVFGKLRDKSPELLEKIKVVQGDVTMPNLGINEIDRQKLYEQVNIVFHSAATVRFNESLKDAVTLNTLGTKRVVEFCVGMKALKSFVHVSTAYSNADKRDVEEMVYNPPYDPDSIINCMEALPADAIELLSEKLLGKHPNTYTLAKAMAEKIMLDYSGILPVAIVRPSIVTASWKEPFPGWVDNISGITGIMMEIGRGTIKSIVCNENLIVDLIPVDIVANTLITAAWHSTMFRSNSMRVYNCTSGQVNGITWKDYGIITQNYALKYPSKYVTWYPGFTYRTNRVMHWICSVLFHTTPACLLDMLLYCTKHKPIMLRISKKFARAAKAGEFFALNEFNFHTKTVQNLVGAVKSAEDGHNFNVDMSKENGFDWDPYVEGYMLGIRQYVLKDDLSSLPKAKAKLNKFYWANKAMQFISMFIVLRLILL